MDSIIRSADLAARAGCEEEARALLLNLHRRLGNLLELPCVAEASH